MAEPRAALIMWAAAAASVGLGWAWVEQRRSSTERALDTPVT
jgi:hypothetical protein